MFDEAWNSSRGLPRFDAFEASLADKGESFKNNLLKKCGKESSFTA